MTTIKMSSILNVCFYGHFCGFKKVIDKINFVGRQNSVCGVTTDVAISVLYCH